MIIIWIIHKQCHVRLDVISSQQCVEVEVNNIIYLYSTDNKVI